MFLGNRIMLIQFFVFLLVGGHAQNDDVLHFIMAYEDNYERAPNRFQSDFSEYDKVLFRLVADTLAVVDTLNAEKGLRMKMLMHYPEQKLVYFEELGLYESGGAEYISILDYQKDLIIRRFKPEWDSTFQGNTLAIVPVILDGKIFFNNERGRTETDYVDFGRDKFFSKRKLKPQDFQNIVMPGWSGLQKSGPGAFAYNFVKGDYSKMKITRTLDFSRMPITDIQLPDSLKNFNDPHVWVLINNDRYFLGTGTINYTSPTDSVRSIWVYNKKLSNWKRIFLPGLGTSKFMNYEDWLFGAILESKYHLSKNPSYPDSVLFYYKEYNSKYNKENGSPPDFVPLTGKLFLYHLPTDSLITWDSGDRDSEIISIIENIIFYRVFDEIRSVGFDEEQRLVDWKTDRILIKDQERVPYIHWMFFAPNTELKEEWVNKPREE